MTSTYPWAGLAVRPTCDPPAAGLVSSASPCPTPRPAGGGCAVSGSTPPSRGLVDASGPGEPLGAACRRPAAIRLQRYAGPGCPWGFPRPRESGMVGRPGVVMAAGCSPTAGGCCRFRDRSRPVTSGSRAMCLVKPPAITPFPPLDGAPRRLLLPVFTAGPPRPAPIREAGSSGPGGEPAGPGPAQLFHGKR